MSNTILPIDHSSLSRQREDADAALARLQTLPCSTQDEAEFFESILSKAHEKGKLLEAERQELTKPLQAQTKEIQDAFRTVERAYESLKALAKAKVSTYRTDLALAAEASRNLAIVAAQAGDIAACAVALSQVPEDVPTAFTWECGIVNQFDVPREFLEVSTSAIKQYLAKHKNSDTIPSVPGLNFSKKYTVRAK